MTASGGSSGAEARTIVLRNIGTLDDDDLRGTYKYFDSGRDVVERVFTLIDEDSAVVVVVFTHAKYAEKALRLDHGDIIVSRLPTQIFSSVTAVIDRRVTQMFKSKKLWKEYKSSLIRQYGVEIRKQHRGSDLEIFGGSLEVEQCKVFLEKIYKEHVPEEQSDSGDGKCVRGQEEATVGTSERDSEDDERCQSRESENQRKTRDHARTAEGDTRESHDSRHLNGNVQREEAMLSTDQHMAARGSHGNEHDMAEPVRSTEREHSKMSTADRHSASRSSSYGYYDEMVLDDRESHQRNGSSTGEEPSTGEPREVYRDTTTAVSGQFYLIASTRVHIYVGDIRQLSVDVIVSPTDEYLLNVSGMAWAIEKAAGPQLMQECRSIIQRCGPIPIGLGTLTTAGDLPCKKVFHVVRPAVKYSPENRHLTALCYAFTKSLEASKDYHSIAIPAICSGIFGIPMGDVSRIMHEAVSNFCHKQDPTSAIVDIHLVDTNAEAVKLIQQEFDMGLHEDMPKSKIDKSSQRSSGVTTKRSHVVTSSAVNGALSTIDNNSHGSASRSMVSSSVVTGHSPSSAMTGLTSSGAMTGHSPGGAMTGHSISGAMTGHSSSGTMMGHFTGGAITGYPSSGAITGYPSSGTMTGHSSSGTMMGHFPGGAMTGHSISGAITGYPSSGAMTGHSPGGAMTGHSISGAITGYPSSGAMMGHSPGGAMTGHSISGAMTGYSSSGVMTGHSPGGAMMWHSSSGAMTGHSPNGAMTGHSPSGAMTGHSPGGAMTGHSSSGAMTGHSSSGAMMGHSSSGATMGHFPLAASSQSYRDPGGDRAHTSNLYPSLDQGDDIGDGTRPRHGGTSSVTMKHPFVARTFCSDTGNSSQLSPSPLRRCVSSQPSRRQVRDITGEEDTHDDNKACPICLEAFVRPTMLPTCKHVFCKNCIKSSFQLKEECPICRTGYGIIYGTQPANATMTVTHEAWGLPGYYSYGTIVIHYHIPGGIQTEEHPHPGQPYKGAQRGGLLPNNREGKKVLKLLKRAFDQRLTFTVGRSMTTGLDNCVTWNDIHHKTSIDGGPTNFGYPDADYLERVTQDLAAKGIK